MPSNESISEPISKESRWLMSRWLPAASWATSEQSALRWLAIVDLVLGIAFLCLLDWILHFDNGDIIYWYMPWYEHILQYGRWTSMEGSFANYSPPFLYLLSLFSLLRGWFTPLVILKLVELPGMIAAGVLSWSIVRALGLSGARAALTGVLVALTPEVVANALLWGQADMLYTVFVLLILRLLIARRPHWAMAALGVAVAVKLQAIFVVPALFALVLMGELPWACFLWTPVAYAVMMLPAWLAGRPAKELLLIYGNQVATYPEIGRNVANPYQLLQHWAAFSLPLSKRIISAGTLVALGITAVLIPLMARSQVLRRGRGWVAAFALPLILEPFLLPKMHDRYFFAGNVMLVLLATLNSRMILAAIFTQMSALLVYAKFLRNELYAPSAYVLPTLMVAAAISLLVREYLFAGPNEATGDLTLKLSGSRNGKN